MEKVRNQEGENCLDRSENLNKYKCNICKDRLFILQDDNTAKECECRKLRIAEDKLRESGVSEEFRNKTFKNYDYEFSTEHMKAFLIAKNYSKNFNNTRDTRKNSTMLIGQVGSGKTHLAMAIANGLLDDLIGVIYMPYRTSITNLKQNITNEENYQKEIRLYKTAEVLLIDDLFKGKITESDVNIIYEIVDYRYFKSLPIIITTEKSIDDLVEIDEAIGSRLYEMSKNSLVIMKGKKLNYRLYGERDNGKS